MCLIGENQLAHFPVLMLAYCLNSFKPATPHKNPPVTLSVQGREAVEISLPAGEVCPLCGL